jgi:DNA-binding NarL/FixJ family response regulator
MAAKAKIFIVCCNRLLRETIARILKKKTDFEIVATQAPGSTPREQIFDSGANVLVLDSLEFLLANQKYPGGAVFSGRALTCVLVAMEDDHNNFVAAVRRGARGYVLQDASAADVVSAIRAAAEGQVVCPPSYTRVLCDFVATHSENLPISRKRQKWGLTPREQQLIPLIGRGLSNKEIANCLGVSEQTVKNHVHRILRKIGVSDRLSVFEVCETQSSASSTKNSGYPA